MLIGAARIDGRNDFSVRLFDLESEKVTGLFCGLNGNISIEKQHCKERFNCIFVSDSHSSYIYDVRTFQPCMTLHTGQLEGQVLGVPGEAAMVAFAFCRQDVEEIQCWDLRMPVSHAYSMWTGNNDITSLCWDGSSASLLASTSSSHQTLYGNSGCYRYGAPYGNTFDADVV